jgi:uncharacterized protein
MTRPASNLRSRLRRFLPPPVVLALALLTGGCAGEGPAPDPDGILAIGAVQGPGVRSPLTGLEVAVEGIVTAAFEGLGGFFLQSAPGEDDGDPRTSDGIFVFHPPEPGGAAPSLPDPGHRVRVRGTVEERGSGPRTLTSIRAADVAPHPPGEPTPGPLPAPAVIDAPPASVGDWERLEGMLVRIDAPLTVSGQGSLFRFGELVAAFDGRLFIPTELAPPGAGAAAVAARNDARRMVLDDGSDAQWPPDIPWLAELPTHDAPLRAGSELGPVTAVVDVRRGGYLFLPVEPVVVTRQASRPEPPRVEGDLRVAVLNLENLFNGDGRGGGFPTPRGAPTLEHYRLQQAKLVSTLQALEVEVAALSEVENDGAGPHTAIRQFADALNAAGPARDWRVVEVADGPGTDAIRVGILYRSDRVAPVGAPVVPEHPVFEWGSRPPLGQAFVRLGDASGEPWLVVANHFKSKGGCPEPGHPSAAPGDVDAGDGQSCWNAHRLEAADAVADWLATDPAGVGAANALIVGDLNSYGEEDPIRLLRERGWEDAFRVGSAPGSHPPHGYVFQGQAGRLDHVLIHRSRAGWLVGARTWHANADESAAFGYLDDDDPGPWRSSDHDVLVVGIRTRPPG